MGKPAAVYDDLFLLNSSSLMGSVARNTMSLDTWLGAGVDVEGGGGGRVVGVGAMIAIVAGMAAGDVGVRSGVVLNCCTVAAAVWSNVVDGEGVAVPVITATKGCDAVDGGSGAGEVLADGRLVAFFQAAGSRVAASGVPNDDVAKELFAEIANVTGSGVPESSKLDAL